ncbi:E3 ubiquitin-protein ligase UBR5 [Aphelenchoides besseyi]|nr:E3 ubiquitin-protein ligase UBR5 [Aphelenchoides besseyi]
MRDHKELFLFGRAVPSKVDENAFMERIVDAANNRNRYGSRPLAALADIPANQIQQMVVGQNNIGFLFTDNRVARLAFRIVETVVNSEEKSAAAASASNTNGTDANSTGSAANTNPQAGSSTMGTSSSTNSTAQAALNAFGSQSAASAANRTAKIRRMMIAARRPGAICGRTGVIVDRARAMLPASSVPEELIAQAQVVLQGKSREVIVRELQRTNLNVNEAVNNLLSRDDDEVDDLDEAGEYLHEELLSLLDAGLRGEGTAVIDSDGLYNGGDGYDYMTIRDGRKREEAKSKDRKSDSAVPSEVVHETFKFDDELQFWKETQMNGVTYGAKFVKIGSTYSSLFAVADNGQIYAWNWMDSQPTNLPHSSNNLLFPEETDEKIIDMACCAWRIAVMSNKKRVATFVDDYFGANLCTAFYNDFLEVPAGLTVEKLMVCPLYASIQTTGNKIYWWGVYPFADRMQMFENVKKKGREETGQTKEIIVGAEVRTRAIPIYASGSVGVNFSSGVPLIGILMESAWTMTETCRFRVFTPEQYHIYLQEIRDPTVTPLPPINLYARKRAAPSDEGTPGTASKPTNVPSAQYKEDAWGLRQVTFFYEEPVCDTAIVKIVDGSYVGVVYKSAIEQNQKENNGSVDETALLTRNVRLMRKDELVVVPSVKISRSPQTFQRKLLEVKIPRRIRRILSSAVENNCFRILAEKNLGEIAVVTTNGNGSEVNEQLVPIDALSLLKCSSRDNKRLDLENYGDEDILVLRDAAGSIVPLIPDSMGGYREPVYVGFAPTNHMAVGCRFVSSGELSCNIITSNTIYNANLLRKNDVVKNVQRLMLVAALVTPEQRTTEPKIDSLLQNVQYCDLKGVRKVLKQLEECEDDEERKHQILENFTDGNRNILHTATMNAISTTNRDQADDFVGVTFDQKKDAPEKMDTTEADAASVKFDQRWKDMISTGTETALKIMNSPSSSKTSAKSPKDKEPKESNKPKDATEIPINARQRQRNAILIIAELASSPVVSPFFEELMRQRDIHGHTPFYSAVQIRAYTAALIMWKKLNEIQKTSGKSSIEHLTKSGTGGESPLFLMCYNDTCSFTWTGEEHINQDIFECKTCGLVGSLCCCSECAFACHWGHECKLKRTSPTAYCDCWEKCGCKALVAGNQLQRENLLNVLLQDTTLINVLNQHNEHLILFLARTVGRQLVEQENFPRRLSSKIRSSQQQTAAADSQLPEHDLEPPKFALSALQSLLSRWGPVKSLLEVGLKDRESSNLIAEEIFQLNGQSGSSHLDKFTFMLLARCPESHLDVFLNTLVCESNKSSEYRDQNADALISRFVRSVVRLFSFLCISSQQAMNTVLAAIACTLGAEMDQSDSTQKYQLSTSIPPSNSNSTSSKSLLPNYRTITVSGVLSLVRTSLPVSLSGSSSKENRKKLINSFVLKCRRVFQVLITYSLTELLNSSDALMAPVRYGVAKQCVVAHRCINSVDAIDQMEKCLFGEGDYSSNKNGSDSRKKNRRHRGSNGEDRGSSRTRPQDSDGSESDDDSDPGTAPRNSAPGNVENAAALSVAEDMIARGMNDAFREAGLRGNENQNNEQRVPTYHHLSDETDSTDDDMDADPDGYNRPPIDDEDFEDEDGDDEGQEEPYIDDGAYGDEEEHYFRIDDEVVGESGDDYTEDEHYYSSEGDHSPPYPFDEVVDIESSDANARSAEQNQAAGAENNAVPVASGNRRKRNSGSHSRRSTRRSHRDSNPSGARDENGGESMDHEPSNPNAATQSNANSGANAENVQNRTDNGNVEATETATRSNEPEVARQSTGETQIASRRAEDASSNRSHPRVLSSFRGLFNETPNPTRQSQTSGRQTFTTQCKRMREYVHSDSNLAPSIGWAVQRVRQQNDENESTASNDHERANTTAAAERATNAAENNNPTDTTTSSSRQSKLKPRSSSTESDVFQTKIQLSASFAVLLKTIDELLIRLVHYDKYYTRLPTGIEEFLAIEDSQLIANRFQKVIIERVAPTWNWFTRIMDQLEIMLRYGSAFLKSPMARMQCFHRLRWPPVAAKNDRVEKRTEKEDPATSAKHEFFGYFMSLMRTHSAEAGDDMPFMEPAPFRHLSLMAEAYLFHINIGELLETKTQKIAANDNSMVYQKHSKVIESDSVTGKELRRFYRRSDSISYPFMTSAESQNAFKYAAGECLPLALRSALLKPESERADLFMLPVMERTSEEHSRIAREHGFINPTQMSLSDPPVRCENIMNEVTEQEAPESMEVDQPSKPKDSEIKCDMQAVIVGSGVNATRMELQKTLGRWGNSMVYLAKAFHEDIIAYCGNDSFNSILLNEVGGFYLKQSQFKARMEKFKNGLAKDLHFADITRDKHEMISDVFNYLNTQYSRRTAGATGVDANNPPLASNRVKAGFKEEPGEGTGVVRSFYAAFAEALLEMDHLPKDGESSNANQSGGSSMNSGTSSRGHYSASLNVMSDGRLEFLVYRGKNSLSSTSGGGLAGASLSSSTERGVRTRAQQRAAASSTLPPAPSSTNGRDLSSSNIPPERKGMNASQRFVFSLDSAPYVPKNEQEAASQTPSRSSEPPRGSPVVGSEQSLSTSSSNLPQSSTSQNRSQGRSLETTNAALLGERFYERVNAVQPEHARQITGLIVNGLPLVEQLSLVSNDELLATCAKELAEYLKKSSHTAKPDVSKQMETAPLFRRASNHGFMAPIPGTNSPNRRAAFRNVGRIIGLCLQQMDILPLPLCRHVLKFILGRPITWYDLAFYDPDMFDSLRSIAFNDETNTPHSDQFYEDLGLNFVIDIPQEEGGGVLELKPNGENITVNRDNVLEYIYLFVEKRLLDEHVKPLEAIRQGVFDVIPPDTLTGLSSEDLRLILCGTEQVSIRLLETFTTFMDESSSKPELISKYKRWFYSVISKFSDHEKQDLLFFWTGFPSLPSSEEAFTPLPTVMVRPADDEHLPTANTCISRLYLPLYSSKKILRAKLLIAIQTRLFGFV